MSSFVVTLEEDPDTGELIMPLPQALLDEAGWVEGDTLDWQELPNGTFTMSKVDKTTTNVETLTLTRAQVQKLSDIFATLSDLDEIKLSVSRSSGIGQNIIVDYNGKEDITDYENW